MMMEGRRRRSKVAVTETATATLAEGEGLFSRWTVGSGQRGVSAPA
jgi:hypothetical protein